MNPRPCLLTTCTHTHTPRTPTRDTTESRVTAIVLTARDHSKHLDTHTPDEFATELLRLDPGPAIRATRMGAPVVFNCPVRGCGWERTVDTRPHGFWWTLMVGGLLKRVTAGHEARERHVRKHLRAELVVELATRATVALTGGPK
ncbi:hypothetical protein Q8791_22915 [Nocardiopsis sp. CT-R113]|uniref:Uncharacterized protein n=1 Tax=Nocardiopsis codii TaxID=3065942 RepID=A0ABU7KDG5_9ACTN|nr:hypothetical protein [Nocardiopsis sp. CT-R113]MEE2040072.1 hypothetical protein [Nocardiopsis sp. CT-R113]